MADLKDDERTRLAKMTRSLQQHDAMIEEIIVSSQFAVAYLLQQDGTNPGWRKANIEGPVMLLRRRTAPRMQLLVANGLSTNDLVDDLHPDWELDCQKNYVFYKVGDPGMRIRGLWFHDDDERAKIEQAIERCLQELRLDSAQMDSGERNSRPVAGDEEYDHQHNGAQMYAMSGVPTPTDSADGFAITTNSIKEALHVLADDDQFITMVMNLLRESQRGVQN